MIMLKRMQRWGVNNVIIVLRREKLDGKFRNAVDEYTVLNVRAQCHAAVKYTIMCTFVWHVEMELNEWGQKWSASFDAFSLMVHIHTNVLIGIPELGWLLGPLRDITLTDLKVKSFQKNIKKWASIEIEQDSSSVLIHTDTQQSSSHNTSNKLTQINIYGMANARLCLKHSLNK